MLLSLLMYGAFMFVVCSFVSNGESINDIHCLLLTEGIFLKCVDLAC